MEIMQPQSKNQAGFPALRSALPEIIMFCVAQALVWGCAAPRMVSDRGGAPPEAGAGPVKIISSATRAVVSWEEMLADMRGVRIIYVGEMHTAASHHAFQLRVIQGLRARGGPLVVGLEMFDRSYQPVLDRWAAGQLDEESFLRASHWYANWRFDYGLYRDILAYLKQEKIRTVALNLPAHIPPKIRAGGIETLSAYEKGFLPAKVDTTNSAHRDFAQKIFNLHDFKGKARFEDFYMAQCVWEDVMAESIADNMGSDTMVVLAGNGHIQYKYGIPQRAFHRTGLPYRTVVLLPPGETLDPDAADYVGVLE
jgi:uncharacterized iron-regulated protein